MKIGELVTNETVEHFINVLPPACMNGRCIQIGECSDVVNGRSTYPTLKKVDNGWVYAGDCYRGETKEPLENVADYKNLSDNSIDVAEIMLNSCEEEEVFEDMLDEFDIHIKKEHIGELLSRCHSAVTEEIIKFVDEKLKEEKI